MFEDIILIIGVDHLQIGWRSKQKVDFSKTKM